MIPAFLLSFLIGAPFAVAETSVVEVPLRVETSYAKRAAGTKAFYIIFRDHKGRVIAIPEDEWPRFRGLAIEEGFTDVPLGDLYYLPTPTQAVGSTAKAVITIEHSGELGFWCDDHAMFVTWDENHIAPLPTLNGVPIVAFNVPDDSLPPRAPQPVTLTSDTE